MVWYFHLYKNFPQFVVVHTIKGFGIVNKAEINVFLEFSCFFSDPTDINYFGYSFRYSLDIPPLKKICSNDGQKV